MPKALSFSRLLSLVGPFFLAQAASLTEANARAAAHTAAAQQQVTLQKLQNEWNRAFSPNSQLQLKIRTFNQRWRQLGYQQQIVVIPDGYPDGPRFPNDKGLTPQVGYNQALAVVNALISARDRCHNAAQDLVNRGRKTKNVFCDTLNPGE